MNLQEVRTEISDLKLMWQGRNKRFREWYEMLILIDKLYSRGMESYVSNEPQSFYNMSHYLLTKGDISHLMPVLSENAMELDRRAKVNRACKHQWREIDRIRQYGGAQPFIDDLGFFLLVLGWYSTMSVFDKETGQFQAQVWNPYDTYPRFGDNQLSGCLHSYVLSMSEAKEKILHNQYDESMIGRIYGSVTFDDLYKLVDGTYYSISLMNGEPVTDWEERENVKLLVAPVAGFSDRGSLLPKGDWRKFAGRSIYEANATIYEAFNKYKSMISQILRDTAQPITQERSAVAQATPEQLRQRGAHFHFSQSDPGLERVPPGVIPIELQGHLMEIRREMQKASFTDAVYGMMDTQHPSGYSLSLMATSSANQILYPYMDAKHFVISEHDQFWLSNLKTSKRMFEIKGRLIEKLHPKDIPDDVSIIVESDVATPKDWLERGTIANQLKDHLDSSTILTEILKFSDPQEIKRARKLDMILFDPMTLVIEKVSAYEAHADYLQHRGDVKQAARFRAAAAAAEAQMGLPAPGQAAPAQMGRVMAQRKAGAPDERTGVAPQAAPPEEVGGFTPGVLRESIGRGTVKAV